MEVEKVGTEAILTVKNNGQMIPKHSLDSLFDRFYRVEESRSQETRGTGLEMLAICSKHRLRLAWVATFFAKSTPDWTSFIIHLPLKRNDLSNTQNYG